LSEYLSEFGIEKDLPVLEMHRVILADDHAFLRKGLISVLEQSREFQVAGEAGDGMELLNMLSRGVAADVLILDISMPILSGIEVLHRIKQMHYALKILVLTMHKEPDILNEAFSAGANGYMLKDNLAKELFPALHALLENKTYLSPLMVMGQSGN
jgi:DNA-binding NarL/FixJ family response regulator